MKIQKQYLTVSSYNRPGTTRPRTTAVACHYIGNPGTSAQANRNWFESLGKTHETMASCHYIIGLDGEILQLIPEEEISWCTNQANSYTISIEACHPDKTGSFTAATYEAYTALCADICSRWGLDPLKGGLIRHYDVTGKICPKWFAEHPDAWEQFKKDVAARLHSTETGRPAAGKTETEKSETETSEEQRKSGWQKEDGGWRYYQGDTGRPVRNAWHKDKDGEWYWHDGAGFMVCETWKTGADGTWYYLGSDGRMQKDTWVIDQGKLYRLNQDGSMFRGELHLKADHTGALQENTGKDS